MPLKKIFNPGNFKLKVRRSRAGLGLFAEEPVPKGACLIEYTGRVISEKEKYTSRSQYLFEVNSRKTIDGTIRTNTARYINHSCAPNCEIEIYKSRIYVFSRKSLQAGEELSYDYGKEHWNEHIQPKGCRCTKCHAKK